MISKALQTLFCSVTFLFFASVSFAQELQELPANRSILFSNHYKRNFESVVNPDNGSIATPAQTRVLDEDLYVQSHADLSPITVSFDSERKNTLKLTRINYRVFASFNPSGHEEDYCRIEFNTLEDARSVMGSLLHESQFLQLRLYSDTTPPFSNNYVAQLVKKDGSILKEFKIENFNGDLDEENLQSEAHPRPSPSPMPTGLFLGSNKEVLVISAEKDQSKIVKASDTFSADGSVIHHPGNDGYTETAECWGTTGRHLPNVIGSCSAGIWEPNANSDIGANYYYTAHEIEREKRENHILVEFTGPKTLNIHTNFGGRTSFGGEIWIEFGTHERAAYLKKLLTQDPRFVQLRAYKFEGSYPNGERTTSYTYQITVGNDGPHDLTAYLEQFVE